MDKSILKSRIESMDLNELVTFINENAPDFEYFPTIYKNEGDGRLFFLSSVLNNYDFRTFQRIVCRMNETDRYIQCYEGDLFQINSLDDVYTYIASVDNLVDYYADMDEIDIAWPERIINEIESDGTRD